VQETKPHVQDQDQGPWKAAFARRLRANVARSWPLILNLGPHTLPAEEASKSLFVSKFISK